MIVHHQGQTPNGPSTPLCPEPDPGAVVRHWTRHAMERFLERYVEENGNVIPPRHFEQIVPRIEAAYRATFDTEFYRHRARRLVLVRLKVYCERKNAVQRIHLIYDQWDRRVVTALPPGLERKPKRMMSLKI